jgi:hypothetical protein
MKMGDGSTRYRQYMLTMHAASHLRCGRSMVVWCKESIGTKLVDLGLGVKERAKAAVECPWNLDSSPIHSLTPQAINKSAQLHSCDSQLKTTLFGAGRYCVLEVHIVAPRRRSLSAAHDHFRLPSTPWSFHTPAKPRQPPELENARCTDHR